jgi:hypothetical protein
MEWNALTYAGHTVWNVHNENGPVRSTGGTPPVDGMVTALVSIY